MHITVSSIGFGVTDQLTSGVEYIVNGESVGTSLNWWSDYDHTLPSDLFGQLSIEARVLSTNGMVLQRASANTYIAAGGENPPAIEHEGLPTIRLKVSDRCDNPCELAVEVDGAVARVEYFSDGYSLGESQLGGDYMISYRFSQPDFAQLWLRLWMEMASRSVCHLSPFK